MKKDKVWSDGHGMVVPSDEVDPYALGDVAAQPNKGGSAPEPAAKPAPKPAAEKVDKVESSPKSSKSKKKQDKVEGADDGQGEGDF